MAFLASPYCAHTQGAFWTMWLYGVMFGLACACRMWSRGSKRGDTQ